MQKYLITRVWIAWLVVAGIQPVNAREDSGATPSEPLAVVLLPTRAHVREIGFKVRPSEEWTATAGTNIDTALREAVNQSTLLVAKELPSISPEEGAAIDQFLAVATLIQLQGYGVGTKTVTRNLRAFIEHTSVPVLSFLRDRAGVDYVLIPLGTQDEQGTEWVALSAAGAVASALFPPLLVLPSSTGSYAGLFLVDLRTGQVTWFNGQSGHEYGGFNFTDLRDPKSVHRVVAKLLKPYPEIPSGFAENVSAEERGGLLTETVSPPDGEFSLHTPVGWRVRINSHKNLVSASRNGRLINEIKVALMPYTNEFPWAVGKSKPLASPDQTSQWYVQGLQDQKLDDLQIIDTSLEETLAGRPAFRTHFSFRYPVEYGGARMEGVAIGTALPSGLLLAELSATQFHHFAKVLPAFEDATRNCLEPKRGQAIGQKRKRPVTPQDRKLICAGQNRLHVKHQFFGRRDPVIHCLAIKDQVPQQRKRPSFESLLPQGDGGGGGNRTRVRKPYIPGPTCLAVFLILVVHYPSGREDDRPAQERFSEPALSTLDTRACERVPRVWMHKHTPVGG